MLSAAQLTAGMEATSVSSGSDSMRSTSSCDSAYSSSASEGSIAEMDALQRVNKRWEEPLVTLQKQEEVNLRAQKEPKILAEEERIEIARQHLELRDLANCVHDVSPYGRAFKSNKLHKVLSKKGITAVRRFLKNPFRLFKDHGGYPAAQENFNEVVMPTRAKSAFYPSKTAVADPALSKIRSDPWKTRSLIQFETVRSTQGHIEAWTMEEYMTKNARIHKWNLRKDDEKFGGIKKNILMNHYFDDDIRATSDSDSD